MKTDNMDGMSELLTILFEPAGNGKYQVIQLYHSCGAKMHGVVHCDDAIFPPDKYLELICTGCSWPSGLTEGKALKELESAWLEFVKA
jgi:hypothetical protein